MNSISILLLLLITYTLFININATRSALLLSDSRTIQETEFALQALQKLSDSRIYQTLSLSQILSAEEEDGIYHHNTVIKVELSSPYFKSGAPFNPIENV